MPRPFYDVNGDGFLTPAGDFLPQLNYANSLASREGEGELGVNILVERDELPVTSLVVSWYVDSHVPASSNAIVRGRSTDVDTRIVHHPGIPLDRQLSDSAVDRFMREDLHEFLIRDADLHDVVDDALGTRSHLAQ